MVKMVMMAKQGKVVRLELGGAPRDTVPPNQCNCAFGASVQVAMFSAM